MQLLTWLKNAHYSHIKCSPRFQDNTHSENKVISLVLMQVLAVVVRYAGYLNFYKHEKQSKFRTGLIFLPEK